MLECYYMNVCGDCSYEQSLALYKLLPAERQEKIERLKNPDLAEKRILTGAFLQYVLSKCLKLPMEKISYSYRRNGKPMLSEKTLELAGGLHIEFNLSHSGDYAVLAVSDEPVGIDIECRGKNRLAIAKRCFCPEEYEDIMAVETEEEQQRRFLQYWTCKEAYIKWSGEGLQVPLDSFRILRGEHGISRVQEGEVWFATFYMEEKGYCISLCSGQKKNIEENCRKNSTICCLNVVEPQDITNDWKL